MSTPEILVYPISVKYGCTRIRIFTYSSDYPDGSGLDTWTPDGKVRKTPDSESAVIDLDAKISISGQALTLTLSATDTDIAPGNYHYAIAISKAGVRHEIINGILTIEKSVSR